MSDSYIIRDFPVEQINHTSKSIERKPEVPVYKPVSNRKKFVMESENSNNNNKYQDHLTGRMQSKRTWMP